MNVKNGLIPFEEVGNRIVVVRGQKVLHDRFEIILVNSVVKAICLN